MQFLAIIVVVFTENTAIGTDTLMIGGFAIPTLFWVVALAFSVYFVLLLFCAPLIFQARGLGQVLSSYIVIWVALLSFLGGLFKIQAWQYGSEMATLALFLSPILIIVPVFYFIQDGKNLQTRNFIFNMIARVAGIFMFMLGGIFIIIACKILKPRFFKAG